MVQADETPVQVQIEEKPRILRRAYLWAYSVAWEEVVFDFTLSRGAQGPLDFVPESFRGHLQTGGYSGYGEILKRRELVALACMAHARRKFHGAAEHDTRALVVLALMQKLYRIEREAKDQKLPCEERLALRQRESVPVLSKLRELLEKLKSDSPTVLPQSALGEALDYTLGAWETLGRYAEVAEAEIDNNSVENAIRPVALGRKNWLEIGSVAAGARSAILLSLVGSARRMKLDPFVYLRDVIERVAGDREAKAAQLTPRAWKASILAAAGTNDKHGPSP